MSEQEAPEKIYILCAEDDFWFYERSEVTDIEYIRFDTIKLPKLNTKTNKDELRLLLFISEHKRETAQDRVDELLAENERLREAYEEVTNELVQLKHPHTTC